MTLENTGKAQVEQQEWHALKPEEVLSHLKVEGNGLTSEEAKRRLEYYGPNQLKEAPRPSFLHMLWEQLNNFVVILLIVASVISALLGDYVEAGAIMAIVVLNSLLGIIQERRAEEALAALKKLASPDAQVLRDGLRDERLPGARASGDVEKGVRDGAFRRPEPSEKLESISSEISRSCPLAVRNTQAK